MKTRILILLAAFSIASIFAQPPAPEPTLEQMKQLATIVRQQRDALSQQLLDIQSQLQIATAENETLKKKVSELQTKLDEAKPKPATVNAATTSESKPTPKP